MSQQSAPPKPLPSAAAKLFDLRILIGGLFTLYGVILIFAGIFDGPAEIQKEPASTSTCGWASPC